MGVEFLIILGTLIVFAGISWFFIFLEGRARMKAQKRQFAKDINLEKILEALPRKGEEND